MIQRSIQATPRFGDEWDYLPGSDNLSPEQRAQNRQQRQQKQQQEAVRRFIPAAMTAVYSRADGNLPQTARKAVDYANAVAQELDRQGFNAWA